MYKIKKNEQVDTSVVSLLPQPSTRRCYQQYLKYRGEPSIVADEGWQTYFIYIYILL